MYSQEIDKLRKSATLSGEIAQETYYVLKANMLLTDDVEEKLLQLYKSYDQRGVKFAEHDENGTNDLDVSSDANAHDLIHDTNLSIYMTYDDDISTAGVKRSREHEEHDMQPLSKKRVIRSIYTEPEADLNSTQVLEVHENGGVGSTLDSTFAIKPISDVGTNATMLAKKSALKDSNPNVHFVAPKTSAKPPYRVKSTLTSIQREKENKRTPFKLRKSPRRSPVNANKRMCLL